MDANRLAPHDVVNVKDLGVARVYSHLLGNRHEMLAEGVELLA